MSELEKFLQDCRADKKWPLKFEKECGLGAALSFQTGIESLLVYTADALHDMESKPECKLISDTNSSLQDYLPERFQSRYDLDFLRRFYERVKWWQEHPDELDYECAHSVADEIILTLAQRFGESCIDIINQDMPELEAIIESQMNDEEDENSEEVNEILGIGSWAFDLFDDTDVGFLWGDEFPSFADEGSSYHFSKWFEPQFYLHHD